MTTNPNGDYRRKKMSHEETDIAARSRRLLGRGVSQSYGKKQIAFAATLISSRKRKAIASTKRQRMGWREKRHPRGREADITPSEIEVATLSETPESPDAQSIATEDESARGVRRATECRLRFESVARREYLLVARPFHQSGYYTGDSIRAMQEQGRPYCLANARKEN